MFTVNTRETIRGLNERALELVDQVTGDISATVDLRSMETSLMADGSGRWFTLLTFHVQEGDEEVEYRVTSAAPATAPAWAACHTEIRAQRYDGRYWVEVGGDVVEAPSAVLREGRDTFPAFGQSRGEL